MRSDQFLFARGCLVCRPETPRMICGSFHVNQVPDVPHQVFRPDRFLVAKFLPPQRWDVVVFQYPENPSTLYMMRLVGLPGETIHLEGGAVWANGNKLEPPDSLRGIEYLSEIPDWPSHVWGSKEHPAVLGQDEYFVLGDFSPQSKDSRLWEQGAQGHNPFAVPELPYAWRCYSHLLAASTVAYPSLKGEFHERDGSGGRAQNTVDRYMRFVRGLE